MRSPAQPETVLIRIKRFGKEWATCGIGVMPPVDKRGDPRMKKLCPKLVPGQVIELPVSHPLVQKRCRLVEEVDGPEKDEFIRPWVFRSAEEAALANPAKSRLGPEQILDGLTMRDGAIRNAPEHRKKAREEIGIEDEDGPEPEYADEDDHIESDREVARRAQNRAPRDEAHAPAEEPVEQPRRRARRKRDG